MQKLEKILEEIEQRVNYYRDHATLTYVDICAGLREAEGIIRKHMDDGWIPVDERLPEAGQEVWISVKTDYVRRGNVYKTFWLWSAGRFYLLGWIRRYKRSKCMETIYHT